MYRTFSNITEDSNLAMHCLLLQIEDRLERNKNHNPPLPLPPVLFVQLDGGSENINKYMMCLLELLVSQKVFKKIYLNRLPVGHTHEGDTLYL